MRRPSIVWCRMAVVLIAAATAGTCQQPAVPQSPLVGSWLLRAEQVEVALELTAAGRFSRTVKTAEGVENAAGSYQVAGNVLRFVEDGGTEAVAFQIAMPDANTLQMVGEDGTGLELKRVTAGAAQPVGGGIAAPMGGTTTAPVGGGTGGAPLTIPMGGGIAAPMGGTTTAPVGGGGLNDPVPADVQQLVNALLGDLKANAGQFKPREETPGWVTEWGLWGTVQRPPDWHITDKGTYFMDLADQAEISRLMFHTMVTFDNAPSYDEMASFIFNKCTGSSQVVSLGTVSAQTLPFAVADDSGVNQLWCLRWMHPQAGRMFAALSLTVLARPPAPIEGIDIHGLKTTCTYTFTTCPEAQAVEIHKSIFTPMLKSFWFPKGGGGQDSDGDGVNDHYDPAPLNPLVR